MREYLRKTNIKLDNVDNYVDNFSMNISIQIEKTDAQCTERVVTLNIPGIGTDVWLCVSIKARFFFWSKIVKWAIHLV